LAIGNAYEGKIKIESSKTGVNRGGIGLTKHSRKTDEHWANMKKGPLPRKPYKGKGVTF